MLKNRLRRSFLVRSFLFLHEKSQFRWLLNLKDCGKTLDLGCGSCSPVRFLQTYSVGVDLDLEKLREAQKNKTHSALILADLRFLPFRPKTFDTVFLIEVIEHLSKEDGEKLLRKVESIAKRRIIITTPNGFLPQEGGLQKHKSGWCKKELEKLGFRVRGIDRLKPLLDEKGHYRVPIFLGNLLQDLLAPLISRCSFLAFRLLAVKELSAPNSESTSLGLTFSSTQGNSTWYSSIFRYMIQRVPHTFFQLSRRNIPPKSSS